MKRIFVLFVTLFAAVWASVGPSFAGGASKEEIEERKRPISASDFSASVTFASEYVFRGISQTDENPAIQGSLGYEHPIGIYVGAWGSNVDGSISQGNIEIDLYGGYTREFEKLGIGDLGLDVGAIYYWYPGDDSSRPTADFIEGFVSLNYAFKDVLLEPTIGGTYNYSPDFFGEDGSAHWVSGTFDLTLPLQFGLGFEFAYQAVSGDKTTPDGYSYTHWRASLTKEVLGFELELNYQDTSGLNLQDIADARAVFLISRSF
jgi:uncharacterized protein (TIGR02001 family)